MTNTQRQIDSYVEQMELLIKFYEISPSKETRRLIEQASENLSKAIKDLDK